MKLKILVISSYTPSVLNFRGDLVREMAALGHEVVASGPEGGYEGEIKKLGAGFARVPLERSGAGIASDLKYFLGILGLLKKEKPGIVFCYTAKPVVYASLAAKIAGIRRVYPMVTGLGYMFAAGGAKPGILRFIARFLYTAAFACAEKVFFQNSDDMDELLKPRLVSRKKCVIVDGSGVNMAVFGRKPLPDNQSFLMVSRLLRSKGVMEYLEAARRVKESCPGAEFSLVGPMEESGDSVSREELEPYLENNTARYFGPREDVRPFLEECLVYVLPSYREGTPRTVLEALATGRPVITTSAPGCRETVEDGVNGYLVPPRDPAALAESMLRMLANRDKLPAMADAGYRMCRERFDVGKVNKKILREMGLVP